MKYLLMMGCFFATATFAQSTEVLASNEVKKEEVATANKEMTIQLKNNSERKIALYAGDKKEVFDGKAREIGGLSKNTLYLKVGDAVCIMNDTKTIQACTIIKETMNAIEINSSGNGFLK